MLTRYGITAPRAFGVPVGRIQQLAKRQWIGRQALKELGSHAVRRNLVSALVRSR